MCVENRRLRGELGGDMFAKVATPRLQASYNIYVYKLSQRVRWADEVKKAECYLAITVAIKCNPYQMLIFNRINDFCDSHCWLSLDPEVYEFFLWGLS